MLFNYIAGEPFCIKCKTEMEEVFKVVKDYINNNQNATIDETALQCGVTASDIKRWLREGRLELTNNSAIKLGCKSCGKQIRSGNLCDACTKMITVGFADVTGSGKTVSEKRNSLGYYLKK